MPKITDETPLRDLMIAGMQFKVPAPYGEGHTLTANEASALNGVLAENLRNNFAIQIKRQLQTAETNGTEKPSLETLQSELTDYAAEYEFGVRRTSSGSIGTSADPVEAEAQKMARELVKVRIKERGYKLKSFTDDAIQDLCDKLLAARPGLREEAARRVQRPKAISGSDDIPLPEPTADAEAAAEPQPEA